MQCFFFDFSKGFDTVNHAILVKKLDRFFGIRGKELVSSKVICSTDINLLKLEILNQQNVKLAAEFLIVQL